MNEESLLADWIIDQMSDALIYIDDQGIVRRWNQAACDLFGYSAAEMLGNGLDPIIPEHLRAGHHKGFHAAVASGKTRLQGRPTVTRAMHKNGAKRYVEMTFALVRNPDGKVMGSVAVARDVTEKVEQARRAAS